MEKIIIVEDDLVFCKLLTSFLGKHSYITASAMNGQQAIEAMENQDFDLAIVDYRLPDTNGIDLLQWIGQNRRTTKAVLMSQMKDDTLPQKAKNAGAVAFVSKPFKPNQLLEIIHSLS